MGRVVFPLLLLAGACDGPADSAAAVPPAGEQTYALYCSSCHGEGGDAGVQVDGVPATDLATAVPALDDLVEQSVRDLAQPPDCVLPAPFGSA